MNELQKRIYELMKEIIRCNKANDGDEHVSKANWQLRGQFVQGELEGIEFAKKEFLKLLDNFKDYRDWYEGNVINELKQQLETK